MQEEISLAARGWEQKSRDCLAGYRIGENLSLRNRLPEMKTGMRLLFFSCIIRLFLTASPEFCVDSLE